MATHPPRLHLVHFSVDAADENRDDDDDDERTTERKVPHACALLWCDEATAQDPPSGCVPVDPVAGLASAGPGYRGVRGAEAVAALVGACASAAHVVPDSTQRSKPDEELRIAPNTSSSSSSSEPLAVSPSAMALCVRVAAALGDDDGWRPTRVCELGSGTGAAGLLVARMLTSKRNAKTRPLVLLTDRDTAALEVIASNVRLNARGWARCVPQRLQWDRRDERSRATRRAADDDRSSSADDDRSLSGVFLPAPFDLVLASDVLRGSRVDDARHLLDTATELLSGARRGARLVLSHPVSDAVSFAAKSSARGVKSELTHLDFVDDDDDFVDGEHGDVGADEGDDDALDAFVAAARARGFAVREHPETKTKSQKPKPKKNQKPRVRTFDVYLPGACPGAHLAGYVDVAARRAVELEREEDRGLRDLMRERYARGWTPPPSPPVPRMEPPARSSSSSIGTEEAARGRDGDGGGGGRKIQSSPGKRKKGGFCVVS
jgi:hypothetical protein